MSNYGFKPTSRRPTQPRKPPPWIFVPPPSEEEQQRLDDLSSDSDDEYFDVVQLPGLRPPQVPPTQASSTSPVPHQQQPKSPQGNAVQDPLHLPPAHSRSMPAVNKGIAPARMGNAQPQSPSTAGTEVSKQPGNTAQPLTNRNSADCTNLVNATNALAPSTNIKSVTENVVKNEDKLKDKSVSKPEVSLKSGCKNKTKEQNVSHALATENRTKVEEKQQDKVISKEEKLKTEIKVSTEVKTEDKEEKGLSQVQNNEGSKVKVTSKEVNDVENKIKTDNSPSIKENKLENKKKIDETVTSKRENKVESKSIVTSEKETQKSDARTTLSKQNKQKAETKIVTGDTNKDKVNTEIESKQNTEVKITPESNNQQSIDAEITPKRETALKTETNITSEKVSKKPDDEITPKTENKIKTTGNAKVPSKTESKQDSKAEIESEKENIKKVETQVTTKIENKGTGVKDTPKESKQEAKSDIKTNNESTGKIESATSSVTNRKIAPKKENLEKIPNKLKSENKTIPENTSKIANATDSVTTSKDPSVLKKEIVKDKIPKDMKALKEDNLHSSTQENPQEKISPVDNNLNTNKDAGNIKKQEVPTKAEGSPILESKKKLEVMSKVNDLKAKIADLEKEEIEKDLPKPSDIKNISPGNKKQVDPKLGLKGGKQSVDSHKLGESKTEFHEEQMVTSAGESSTKMDIGTTTRKTSNNLKSGKVGNEGVNTPKNSEESVEMSTKPEKSETKKTELSVKSPSNVSKDSVTASAKLEKSETEKTEPVTKNASTASKKSVVASKAKENSEKNNTDTKIKNPSIKGKQNNNDPSSLPESSLPGTVSSEASAKKDSLPSDVLSKSLVADDSIVQNVSTSIDSTINKEATNSPATVINSKQTDEKSATQQPNTSASNKVSMNRKVRAGSPTPGKSAVMGVKITAPVIKGKLQITPNSGPGPPVIDKESSVADKTDVKDATKPTEVNIKIPAEERENASVDSKETKVNDKSNVNNITDSSKITVETPTKEKATAPASVKNKNSDKNTSVNGHTFESNKKDKTISPVIVNGVLDDSELKVLDSKLKSSVSDKNVPQVNKSIVQINAENGIADDDTNKDDFDDFSEMETFVDRSRCSSVASDTSRTMSPDVSLRTGVKRIKSEKLSAMMNLWENDDISQASEKSKLKSSSNKPKVGKISGLKDMFESGKAAEKPELTKNPNLTKLRSQSSAAIVDPKATNKNTAPAGVGIASMNAAKFGGTSKFKKPQECSPSAGDKILKRERSSLSQNDIKAKNDTNSVKLEKPEKPEKKDDLKDKKCDDNKEMIKDIDKEKIEKDENASEKEKLEKDKTTESRKTENDKQKLEKDETTKNRKTVNEDIKDFKKTEDKVDVMKELEKDEIITNDKSTLDKVPDSKEDEPKKALPDSKEDECKKALSSPLPDISKDSESKEEKAATVEASSLSGESGSKDSKKKKKKVKKETISKTTSEKEKTQEVTSLKGEAKVEDSEKKESTSLDAESTQLDGDKLTESAAEKPKADSELTNGIDDRNSDTNSNEGRFKGSKKLVGIKSFIESAVAKGGKTLEDKLSKTGIHVGKKTAKTDNQKDSPTLDSKSKKKLGLNDTSLFTGMSGSPSSITTDFLDIKSMEDLGRNKSEYKESLVKAVPALECNIEALIKEASDLLQTDERPHVPSYIPSKLTLPLKPLPTVASFPDPPAGELCVTSLPASPTKEKKRFDFEDKHRVLSLPASPTREVHFNFEETSEGEEEVFVDAIDPTQLDTLMPLPDVQNERDRRSRSRTPMDFRERSVTPSPVVAESEAILSETDRLLRRSRSNKSLRRSYSRSLSSAALNRLSEVTADLSEEHTTAHLAGERLEAEQAERMKLEKEIDRLQTDVKRMTTANGKLEMEKLALRSEVLSAAELNGDVDDDEAADASLYKRKYEWCLREIELLKKQSKQQQEDDLDQLLLLKKQLEKKVADAYEETDEQRQVVAQLKRKSQRLQAEMNDLKILLEEQTSRNNLLEKKQRKFDQEVMGVQEELRHERANKDKIQRERDQILSEKYSFEQEVTTLKLELELKEEKVSALNRELDDLTSSGKVEEEVATLKKAKHDLELRIKDQEEELDDLAGQVQMLEGAKVRLEMSMEQMRKENRREISQREEELEDIRMSAQKKIKSLEAQLENEHEERTLLVREKHELERRIADLQDRTITHVDEDYVHKLKKELKKTKALLRDTQTMLEKAQSEGSHKLILRQLKTQLEDAEFAKTAALKARQCAESDLADTSSQLDEALKAKKEAEDRCARVNKERAEIQTQLEESEEEVAEVMKKYKAVVSQLSVDQITLSEQSQQIAELEHSKQVLQERMLELSSKVEVLEGETANIHTQRRLEMKIKEVESKLELELTTRQRLESQIGRLKDQIERLSGECDAAKVKESQAMDQSKRLGRQLRDAKEDLSNIQQRHTEVANKKSELEKQLELSDAEVITLKSDLKLAFKRIEDLQQAIQGDISDSDSELSDSDSDSDGSLSSYLTASLKQQRSSSNSTLRTPPSEVQQLERLELPHSPCSEAMSAISEDLDDTSNKESFA